RGPNDGRIKPGESRGVKRSDEGGKGWKVGRLGEDHVSAHRSMAHCPILPFFHPSTPPPVQRLGLEDFETARVGGEDAGFRAGEWAKRGGGDRRKTTAIHRETNDRRARSAEPPANGPGAFASADDFRELRNQALAMRLMDPVLKDAP